MNFKLYKIYEELMKKGMSFESIYNSHYPKSDIIRELSRESRTWCFNVDELIDVNNWNLDNLAIEEPERYMHGNIYYESYIRKPKAYFELFITKQSNIALDWYPYNPASISRSLEKTDWLHWDNKWPIGAGQLPFNRLLMIRNFESIMQGYKKNKYNKIDQYIIEWTKSLIENVYMFLDRFIEIEKITDLYLKYTAGNRKNELISCEIRNVREAEEEFRSQEKMNWINDTCEEFGITPDQFLKSFKKNDMKYAPTARELSTKSKKFTESRVKKLLRELYNFPELYDEIFEHPPKGVAHRGSDVPANVVEFPKP